jgi:hypothetical protein
MKALTGNANIVLAYNQARSLNGMIAPGLRGLTPIQRKMLMIPLALERLAPALITGAIMAVLLQPAVALGRSNDSNEDRSRLLLVFAPDENSKELQTQYAELERDTAEVNGEDVNVVYVVGDRPVKLPPPEAKTESAANLRKHYHVDATGFRVVLVGRDGWEKARWQEPTDPHVIIDHAADMPKPKSALDPQR